MALTTVNPTSNTTPDPGQGGLAVAGAINTGHGVSTTQDLIPPSPVIRSCKWTGFSSPGSIINIQLRFDWAYINGAVDTGDGGSNQFKVEYSVNGGGAWSAALNQQNVSGSNSGAVNLNISTQQDLSVVQVRDFMQATAGATVSSRIDPSISNIRLEVTTVDAQPIVMI